MKTQSGTFKRKWRRWGKKTLCQLQAHTHTHTAAATTTTASKGYKKLSPSSSSTSSSPRDGVGGGAAGEGDDAGGGKGEGKGAAADEEEEEEEEGVEEVDSSSEDEWGEDGSKKKKTKKKKEEKTDKKKGAAKGELSEEQKGILRHVMEGKNCYYSGRAGSGKSHLLRSIIDRAPAGKTFITASTGIAAINIGGTTLHSFAGIGLGEDPVEVLKERAAKSRTAGANWAACEVLIVDEVSMLHGSLLAKLDQIAKHCKGSSAPFGGIQLIFTGDFFQLPPVSKGRGRGGGSADHDYAFLHPVWQQLFPVGCCFELSRVFRQAETALVDLLSDVRYGNLTQPSLRLLQELRRELRCPEGIEPTLLFSTNERVDRVNQQKLLQLPGPEHVFEAEDSGKEPYLSQMRKNCLAEAKLRLRVGAQVMLIKNISSSQGLVNGSTGRIKGFTQDEDHWPIVEFSNGVEQTITQEEWSIEMSEGPRTSKKASRMQVPLKLGWAITIHKSQGMGLQYLECELQDVFEEGQGYVALSRAITLEGLRVVAFNPQKFRVSPRVIEFYENTIKGRSKLEASEEETWEETLSENWSRDHPKYKEGSTVGPAVNGGGGGGYGGGGYGGGGFGGGGGGNSSWRNKRDGPYASWQSGSVSNNRKRGRDGGGGGGGQWLPRLPSAVPPVGAPPQYQHQHQQQQQAYRPPGASGPYAPAGRSGGGGGGGGGFASAGAGAGAGGSNRYIPPYASSSSSSSSSAGQNNNNNNGSTGRWVAPHYRQQQQQQQQTYQGGGGGGGAAAGAKAAAAAAPRPAFAPAASARGGNNNNNNSNNNKQGGGGGGGESWDKYQKKKNIPSYTTGQQRIGSYFPPK